MEPIINPWVFYWIEVCDDVVSISIFLSVLCAVAFLFYCASESCMEDGIKISKRWAKRIAVIFGCSLGLLIFIPTSDTCYKMLVSSMVTKENLKEAKQVILDTVRDVKKAVTEEPTSEQQEKKQ